MTELEILKDVFSKYTYIKCKNKDERKKLFTILDNNGFVWNSRAPLFSLLEDWNDDIDYISYRVSQFNGWGKLQRSTHFIGEYHEFQDQTIDFTETEFFNKTSYCGKKKVFIV